jgi:hypothetical protein
MIYLTPTDLETAYGNMQPGDKPIVYYAGSDQDLQFNRSTKTQTGKDAAGNPIYAYQITPLGQTMRMALWLHENAGALLFSKRTSAMTAPYVGEMYIVKASEKTTRLLDHMFDNSPLSFEAITKRRMQKEARSR